MSRNLLLSLAGILIVAAAVVWWLIDENRDVVADMRANPNDSELVALGERIYKQNCAACHGANLEGQANWRTRLPNGRLPAPPHDETGHTWHHDDETLFALTKFGPAVLVGSDYESDMPAYRDILSDREIWAVLAFIKNAWPADVQERQQQISLRAKGPNQ